MTVPDGPIGLGSRAGATRSRTARCTATPTTSPAPTAGVSYSARLGAAALPVARADHRTRGRRQLDQPRRLRQHQLVLPRHRAPQHAVDHQPVGRRGGSAAARAVRRRVGAGAVGDRAARRSRRRTGHRVHPRPAAAGDHRRATCLRRTEFRARPAADRGAARPDVADLLRLHLPIRVDHGVHPGQRGFGGARRGMSGLRAAGDRLPARQRTWRPVMCRGIWRPTRRRGRSA